MKKRSTIHISNCQIKSLEKLQALARGLDIIEKECGIHSVRITLEDMFICPDIDLTIAANSKDPMEKLVGELCIQLDKKKYGKESKYHYQQQL